MGAGESLAQATVVEAKRDASRSCGLREPEHLDDRDLPHTLLCGLNGCPSSLVPRVEVLRGDTMFESYGLLGSLPYIGGLEGDCGPSFLITASLLTDSRCQC